MIAIATPRYFRIGMAREFDMDDHGKLLPLNWRMRLGRHLAEALWPRTPMRVSAVDVDRGVITMENVQ